MTRRGIATKIGKRTLVALFLSAACVATVEAAPATTAATSSAGASNRAPALVRAIQYFEQGNYEEAKKVLELLLYPTPTLTTTIDRVEAHVFLAASLFALDDAKAAARELTSTFAVDRHYRFPPLFDPDLVALAEEIRKTLPAEVEQPKTTAKIPPVSVDPDPTTALPPKRAPSDTKSSGFRAIRLVPFGVGQYADRRTGRGTAFLVAETLLLGTNLISGAMLRGKSDAECVEDLSGCRRLQTLQNVSLYAFAGVAVWGIVDAIVLAPEKSNSSNESADGAQAVQIKTEEGIHLSRKSGLSFAAEPSGASVMWRRVFQ